MKIFLTWLCLCLAVEAQTTQFINGGKSQFINGNKTLFMTNAAGGGGYNGTPDIAWWKGYTGSGTSDTATVGGVNMTLQNADMWQTSPAHSGTSNSSLGLNAYRYENGASSTTFGTKIITVEMRIYSTTFANSGFAAEAMFQANCVNDANAWGLFNDADSGTGKFLIFMYDNGFNLATYSITRPSTSTWHHIAIVFDNSAANAPLAYVDGSSVSVTLVTDPRSSFANFASAVVYSGASISNSGNDFGFYPAVYDLRIWSGARSAANIALDAANYP